MPTGRGAAGQRYNDEYSYRPPASPSPTHNKPSGKEQYEMQQRSNSAGGLGSTEAFFTEVGP